MHVDDAVRFRHMLEAAERAMGYAQGRFRSDLDGDTMLVDALVRNVTVIGEAARHVSDEGRAACPELPWPKIMGMRHRLVHDYYDINLDVLWQTCSRELPGLASVLQAVLARPD